MESDPAQRGEDNLQAGRMSVPAHPPEVVAAAAPISSPRKHYPVGRLLDVLETLDAQATVLPNEVPIFCGDLSPGELGKRGLLKLGGIIPHDVRKSNSVLIECQAPGCSHLSGGMSPLQFEAHCGRGSAKKWKESIRVQSWPEGVPLPLRPPRVTAPRSRAVSAGGDLVVGRGGAGPHRQRQPNRDSTGPHSLDGHQVQQKLTKFFSARTHAAAPSPEDIDVGQNVPLLGTEADHQAQNARATATMVELQVVDLTVEGDDSEAAEKAARAAEQKLRKRRRARVMKEGQLAVVVYGASEEMMWTRRLAHFTETMRGVLGDRRFNVPWGGSVVDSVVGTYLTQNVSDTLSSQAYMTLLASFRSQAEETQYVSSGPRGRISDRANSVDWMAVRSAPASQVQSAIRCRGFQTILAGRIQHFLSHVIMGLAEERLAPDLQQQALRLSNLSVSNESDSRHRGPMPLLVAGEGEAPAPELCRCGSPDCSGDICLEWLRALPGQEANAYLSSCGGLGRKSCACISLLTLGHKDFPVDVNVGRICARLGWIPLDSESALEELDEYAPEPLVHAFLRSRLLGLMTLQQLYELHYQMITLGKVFCSKRKPNCSACPLQSVCEYALAGGPRLDLHPTRASTQGAIPSPASAAHQHEQSHGVDDVRKDASVATPPPQQGHMTGAPLYFEALGKTADVIESVLAAAGPMYDNSATWEDKRQAALEVLGGSFSTSEPVVLTLPQDPEWQQEATPDATARSQADLVDLTAERDSQGTTLPGPLRQEAPEASPQQPAEAEARLAPETPTKGSGCPSGVGQHQSPRSDSNSTDGGTHHQLILLTDRPNSPPARSSGCDASDCSRSSDESGRMLQALIEAVAHAGREAELESFVDGSGGPSLTAAGDRSTLTPPTSTSTSPVAVEDAGGQPEPPETPQAHAKAPSVCCRLFQPTDESDAELNHQSSADGATDGFSHGPGSSCLSPSQSASTATAERRLQLRYHSMGRLIHPDKCWHPMAQHAFAAVSRAYAISVTTYQTSWSRQYPATTGSVAQTPPSASDASATAPLGQRDPGHATVEPPSSGVSPESRQELTGLDAVEASGLSAEPSLADNRLRRRFGAFEICEEVLEELAPWLPPRLPEDPGRVLAFVRPRGCQEPDNVAGVIDLCAEPLGNDHVEICLLVPCRSALLGRFPLNGTYFQVNELFADKHSLQDPLRVPRARLHRLGEAWPRLCQVYSGVSVPSICRGMQTAEVADLFSRCHVCIRAYDFHTDAPSPLPGWMMPQRQLQGGRARPRQVAAVFIRHATRSTSTALEAQPSRRSQFTGQESLPHGLFASVTPEPRVLQEVTHWESIGDSHQGSTACHLEPRHILASPGGLLSPAPMSVRAANVDTHLPLAAMLPVVSAGSTLGLWQPVLQDGRVALGMLPHQRPLMTHLAQTSMPLLIPRHQHHQHVWHSYPNPGLPVPQTGISPAARPWGLFPQHAMRALQGGLHFQIPWESPPAEAFWTAYGPAAQHQLRWVAKRRRTHLTLRPRHPVPSLSDVRLSVQPEMMENVSHMESQLTASPEGKQPQHLTRNNEPIIEEQEDHLRSDDVGGHERPFSLDCRPMESDGDGSVTTGGGGYPQQSNPGQNLAVPTVPFDSAALDWLRSKQAERAACAQGVLWMRSRDSSGSSACLWPVQCSLGSTAQLSRLREAEEEAVPSHVSVRRFSDGTRAAPVTVESGELKLWAAGVTEVLLDIGPSLRDHPALLWAVMQAYDSLRTSCRPKWQRETCSSLHAVKPSRPRKRKAEVEEQAAEENNCAAGDPSQQEAVQEPNMALLDTLRNEVVCTVASCNNVIWGKVPGFRFWPGQIVPDMEVRRCPGFSSAGRAREAATRPSGKVPVQFFGTSETLWLRRSGVKAWADGLSLGCLRRIPKWQNSNTFITALEEVHTLLMEDRPPSDKLWWDRGGRRGGLRSRGG